MYVPVLRIILHAHTQVHVYMYVVDGRILPLDAATRKNIYSILKRSSGPRYTMECFAARISVWPVGH